MISEHTAYVLNIVGLIFNSCAAILLVISAPVPQRVTYFGDEKDVPRQQRKDRKTKRAYWFALWMLLVGFLLQLVAQIGSKP